MSGTLNGLRLLLRFGAASGNLCSSNQTVQQQQQQQIPLINGLRALIPPHAFRFNAPTPAEAGLALVCFALVWWMSHGMLCHQFSICFNKEFRQQQQQQQQQERAKVPGKKCCTTLLPAMDGTHNNDTAMSRLPQALHRYPLCPTLRLDSLSEKLQVCQTIFVARQWEAEGAH